MTLDRLVRNQLLFREVNDRISEVVERFSDSLREEADFVCECSKADCVAAVQLGLDEYKKIRSSPTLFIVVPGHETLLVEHAVERNDRFMLVETARRVELVEGDGSQ